MIIAAAIFGIANIHYTSESPVFMDFVWAVLHLYEVDISLGLVSLVGVCVYWDGIDSSHS